jgi:hypothetical protein
LQKRGGRCFLPRKNLKCVPKIPIELADEVDKILEKKLLGYLSRAEFVAEAVRNKVIRVNKKSGFFVSPDF